MNIVSDAEIDTEIPEEKAMPERREEFYKKYRPREFKHIVGQPEIVAMCRGWVKSNSVPQTILLSGPSGCGKTSIARIFQKKLGCDPHDFTELNCADFRGVDTVRDIRRAWGMHAIGQSRIWLLDEAHRLTPEAQDALLKILEDTKDGCYFFLATTNPTKLLKTIQNRASALALRSVIESDMRLLLNWVAREEGGKLDPKACDLIITEADGSPRKALVILNAVLGIADRHQQRRAVQRTETKTDAVEIAKLLVFGRGRDRWQEMSKLLKSCDLEDPEGIRRLVLAWATTCLLNKNNPRAAMVIDYFRDAWYESGKAGLVLACYEICVSK
jgi:DNA polymerase III gamma/tau subunit